MDIESLSKATCVNSCTYKQNYDTSTTGSDADSDTYNPESPIEEDYTDIPIPYTFRINASFKGGKAKSVICPPFYLQLDHVIAVLWKIFDKNKEKFWPLGVTQLQWALYFLKAIKDPNEGIRSPDVEIAIQAIEDSLLECYADMANIVMRSPPPQGIPCIICDLEKNIPKSTCDVCTSVSWGIMGRPRKSIQKEDDNQETKFKFVKRVLPVLPDPSIKSQQTKIQVKNEIEQLKFLALNLSVQKPVDMKRKKVRVKSFAFPEKHHPGQH